MMGVIEEVESGVERRMAMAGKSSGLGGRVVVDEEE